MKPPDADEVDAVGLDLARRMSAAPTTEEALHRLTATAATLLPATDGISVTLLRDGGYDSVAMTSDLCDPIDTLQYELNGPCLAALTGPSTQVRVDDLRTDTRWPEFVAAATARTSVRSVLSCRLYVRADRPRGTVNLYAREAHAFDLAASETANRLAGHGALALTVVEDRLHIETLQRALASSRTIGAAIGILMTRHLLTETQAFDLLRKASQHRNRKLRDIAADVLETGLLPLPGGSP